MPTTRVNGVDLAYHLHGSGPRVLFCNGSGTTMESMQALISILGDGLELLAFDYRGMGASSAAPGPYGMAACAADAIGLLDHVGWATTRVVGVSFGGMVAQELAVTVPQRIERLALLCTSPGGAGGSSYPLHELETLDADGRAAARTRLLDTRFDDAWLDTHPRDRALVDMLDRSDTSVDPVVEAGRRAQLEARRGHDVWDRLPAISCPTLVACGRFDPIAPMANGEQLASRIPGAELRAYDGGHAFFVQDPKAFPDIRAFLTAAGP